MRNPSASLSMLTLCLAGAFDAVAEDAVTVRTPGAAGLATVKGSVLDWTGQELTIRSGDGVRSLPADRVTAVVSPRLERHVAGLARLAAGEVAEARERLRTALAEEPRVWMRREILAALVRADLAAGATVVEDRAAAGADFLAIVESDPATRFFPQIPLLWGTEPSDAPLAAAAAGWLWSDAEAARLLGASALLFDPATQTDAAATLDRLAASVDDRIYPFARAQLWRRTLSAGPVAFGEIERWEARTAAMPEPLRGGPHFVIGSAWAAADAPDRAAAALLWLPLVYDEDPSLAALAEVRAAEQLSRSGRTADAVVLYREVLARWPHSPAAGSARERRAAFEKAATTNP